MANYLIYLNQASSRRSWAMPLHMRDDRLMARATFRRCARLSAVAHRVWNRMLNMRIPGWISPALRSSIEPRSGDLRRKADRKRFKAGTYEELIPQVIWW